MASTAAGAKDAVQRMRTSPKKLQARLEPSSLYHSNGKRPDGITVVSWKSVKLLVGDAVCPDTFAPSYASSDTSEAGAVASQEEESKEAKHITSIPPLLFKKKGMETVPM